MIDQDNTFFNFPQEAKARARDLAQQLLANKKSSAAKKLLDSSINDEVKAQSNYEKMKAFFDAEVAPSIKPVKKNNNEVIDSNKSFVEPKNQTIQKNQTMQNIENPIEQMYKD